MPDPQRHRNRHRAPTRAPALCQEPTRPGVPLRTDEDIHVCPECASEMVQPVEWAPVDMRRWRVALRCPECSWRHEGIYAQHVLDRFDTILNEGVASLLDDLDMLERANLEYQVDTFVAALAADHVLPEDF